MSCSRARRRSITIVMGSAHPTRQATQRPHHGPWSNERSSKARRNVNQHERAEMGSSSLQRRAKARCQLFKFVTIRYKEHRILGVVKNLSPNGALIEVPQ